MCQYNFENGSPEEDGQLKSPGGYLSEDAKPFHPHNLDCTWLINVQDGYTIRLEITFFRVRSKIPNSQKIYHDLSKIDYYCYSCCKVTIYLFMMCMTKLRQRLLNWIQISMKKQKHWKILEIVVC